MYKFKEISDELGRVQSLEIGLKGKYLLAIPEINKGSAFTHEEREAFGLVGKLPAHVESLEEQVSRYYRQYQLEANDLARNLFLNRLRQHNNIAFFKLVMEHLEEMMPIVYTPTIGDAVKSYSYQFEIPRGLHFSYQDRDRLDEMVNAISYPEVDLMILTDGEGVLGIGDWGIGGVDICVGKMMVYTLCGGLNPRRMLPIQLDVGTNNQQLLNDPMYLGWRHERITGAEYDEFIEQVIQAIHNKFPNIFIHWEDFGIHNARRILNRNKDKICTFNDDIQGTGATTLACVLSGLKATGGELKDQKFVVFGAGTAGVGITDQLCSALVREGLTLEEAQSCFWLLDRPGLLIDSLELLDFQKPYARKQHEVANWSLEKPGYISLLDVVKAVKPTVLIGCSAVTGAFSEAVVTAMATGVARPIILPLSNPTSRAEAVPEDLFCWTDGKVLTATGSPFSPVEYNGKNITISQCNNAFIFPGLGLGVLASKATRVTEKMIAAAAYALSDCSPMMHDPEGALLPNISNSHSVSLLVAKHVAKIAREEGVATVADSEDLDERVEALFWKPQYLSYEYKPSDKQSFGGK